MIPKLKQLDIRVIDLDKHPNCIIIEGLSYQDKKYRIEVNKDNLHRAYPPEENTMLIEVIEFHKRLQGGYRIRPIRMNLPPMYRPTLVGAFNVMMNYR